MSRISFEGFNNQFATFEFSGNVKQNDLVSINASGKVVAASEGDILFGVCTNKRDNIVTVQLSGYAELESNGDITECGIMKIVCADNSYIRIAEDSEDAPYVRVVKVSTDSEVVGIIF